MMNSSEGPAKLPEWLAVRGEGREQGTVAATDSQQKLELRWNLNPGQLEWSGSSSGAIQLDRPAMVHISRSSEEPDTGLLSLFYKGKSKHWLYVHARAQ